MNKNLALQKKCANILNMNVDVKKQRTQTAAEYLGVRLTSVNESQVDSERPNLLVPDSQKTYV